MTAIIDIQNHLPAHRVEYHRHGAALLPDISDPDPGMAILIMAERTGVVSLSCNCRAFKKKKNCPHIGEVSGVVDLFKDDTDQFCFDGAFRAGPWYRLAAALNEACHVDSGRLTFRSETAGNGNCPLLYFLRDDVPVVAYYPLDRTADTPGVDEQELLVQRLGIVPQNGHPFHRGRAIDMLASMTLTDSESVMQAKNLKSRRQVLEKSFWYRLAYHCKNLFGQSTLELETRIEDDGTCVVCCRGRQQPVFEIYVPNESVVRVIKALGGDHQAGSSARLLPESLESIVKVSADENKDLVMTLYLILYLPDGSTEVIERRRLKKYWFRDSVYVPWRNVIATWRTPDLLWKKFDGRFQKKIRRDRIPEIIENIEEFFAPPNIVDEQVQQMMIHRDSGRVIITPAAEDRDWCWLSVDYGFGENATLSLAEIYRAKLSGQRYLAVSDGWVDTRSIDLAPFLGEPGNLISRQLAGSETRIKFSRTDLLRLQAVTGSSLEIRDEPGTGQGIRSLLNMVPAAPINDLDGFTSCLRDYQHKGLAWMAFLFENGFGGLLCDEMGLGKTHQVMGLMVWLLRVKKETGPFLVICPTTVISHWERKITDYAPALRPIVYHGTDRELTARNKPGTVVITSYGILHRDFDRLSKINFCLSAFDEAQAIKNTDTKSYAAAVSLKAAIKIAITGTPIENRLSDLKTLMDLTVPGYLGSDSFFANRYESAGNTRLNELRQLIGPFTLRRSKKVVLSELPEKIEDIRYCRLTETQVRLYRDAVAARRTELIRSLEHEDSAIPYIHIFALLTLLKQICNHPASIANDDFDPGKGPLDSGKWQLFEELLDACLENGQKIVVFTQFVKMIRMIERHLEAKGIGFAGISGQTLNRGQEIDRFNQDADCRVFVGSLKAGGNGIDLIGGSVVIHYDRWWNAAKEDQATDRVHRIGQTRGVQVFKLVTEGTLEEKISAIIERKRKLMADVIKEDDPGMLKTFSRQELIDLISLPE